MKASALKYAVLSAVATSSVIILLLMPLHAFLTVWLASIFGHYTAIRLWKEVLLVLSLAAVGLLLSIDGKIRSHTLTRRLVWLIGLYTLLQLIWGVVAYRTHHVGLKALGYGWIIDLRFIGFFLVTWAVALRSNRLHAQWQNLLLWPAFVVIGLGLLQILVLPNNFLAHFGYNASTIFPYETINHNAHYVRIISTLRGANPLGAYLIIPLTYIVIRMLRGARNWQWWLLLAGCLLVLIFSFSRGAWAGAILSVMVAIGLQVPKHVYTAKRISIAGSMIVVLAVILIIGLHDNQRFQNVFLHTQSHSAVAATSDAGHASAVKSGLRDVAHHPLGEGSGSAGPASIYNIHPARIAENYYIQIGQEVGWVGLFLFLIINAGVGYILWMRRTDHLAVVLLASFVGLSFVNLLSHAWADDTLAYVWWGLAGVAMVPQRVKDKV